MAPWHGTREYMQQYTISWKGIMWYIQPYTSLYQLVQVYRILREMAIDGHKTCINCYHPSSYQFYWHSMAISLRILYTWTSWYKAVCTISCFSMILCIDGCTPLYHVMAQSIYHWQYAVCTSMYWYVLECTSKYQCIAACTPLYHVMAPWQQCVWGQNLALDVWARQAPPGWSH